MSYLDAPSLLSLRQTSSFLFNIIEDNDTLWHSLLQSDFFFPHSYDHPALQILELTTKYHKFSKPTISKQLYMARYLIEGRSNKNEMVFAHAYNYIISFGNYGRIFLALPLLLTSFFRFSLWVRDMDTILISFGGGVMIASMIKHSRKVRNFNVRTGISPLIDPLLPAPHPTRLIYESLVCSILPFLTVYKIFSHLKGSNGYCLLMLGYAQLVFSAITTVCFSVYKLISIGDYRWRWISLLAPTCSGILALQFMYQNITVSNSLSILLFATIPGLLSHMYVQIIIGNVELITKTAKEWWHPKKSRSL